MGTKNAIGIAKAVTLAHLIGKATPVNVMWRITNRCNSKCKYCPVRDRNQKELHTFEILRLIDEMSAAGTQRIGFVGGEALIRDDFEQIVDYARKKNMFITLVSNGYLVPKKRRIIKKLDCVVLSFDGKKKNHEAARGKGTHKQVLEAMDTLHKENMTFLTNTVITKYNITDLNYIISVAEKYRAKCTFNLIQGAPNIMPGSAEYKAAIKSLIKQKLKGKPIVLSVKTLNILENWEDYAQFVSTKPIKGFECWAGRLICNIDTDGRIAPCDILSHTRKDNDKPDCVRLGFGRAFAAMKQPECKACTCAHIIEYNNLFSLHLPTIASWAEVALKR